MTTSNLCCIQSGERIDSPEPPARPLAAIDGIFAAAALPEDHPHAPKIPNRKAPTDTDIIQSPNITNKIKLQFRRSSLRDLKKGKDCDGDARSMTLKEVLDGIETTADRSGKDGQTCQDHCDGNVAELKSCIANTTKRSSVNYSLPLGVVDRTNVTNVFTRGLAKSISSPSLLSNVMSIPPQAGRSFSTSAFGNEFSMPKHRGGMLIDKELEENVSNPESTAEPQSAAASLHVPEITMIDPSETNTLPEAMQKLESSESKSPVTDQRTLLHQMDISQQLRSMSQLSELPTEDAEAITEPWSFPCRQESEVNITAQPARHSRQISSSGIDSATLPPGWGRVRTPVRSTASSIYSRPGSADVNLDENNSIIIEVSCQNAAIDPNVVLTDWPLKSSPTCHDTPRASGVIVNQPLTKDSSDKESSPPTQSQTASRQTSSESAPSRTDHASVRLLSPQPRASSIPSKSSSSTMTKASIAERFFERFSPPKRTVRKRKSIFRFLRPGSRKQQARSVSSPALHTVTADPATSFDGPSDDPALLAVQYELTEQSNQVSRSMSMNHLGAPPRQDTTFHLAPPHHQLLRQPTLADYEKSLTVAGDDRRRPSIVNLDRAKEIHEDDRRDSSGLRRRLSRAHPLQDAASPLMAQALAKHQQEKALFRSASKRRVPSRESHPGPVFNVSAFGRAGSSLPPPSLRDHNDLLDPLEKGYLKLPPEHELDVGHLHPPSGQRRFPTAATSPSLSVQVPSTVPSVIDLRSHITPSHLKKRIGTNLESWSRYPSHSRSERCGSAGLADTVLTRDFAVDINHEEIHIDDENTTTNNHEHAIDSPRSKKTGKSSGERSRFSLPLRRSSGGFGGIVRYYSNLFHTRGWYGQNRRTSITTGGTLEYPELEMLPPQMAESPRHHHDSHPFQHLREQIEKDAGKVKAYVREEEAKLGGFVRKEERKFGEFVKSEEVEIEGLVKREEQKLGDFVRREEGKLRDLVREEEDWFLDVGQHHRRHLEHHKRPSSEHSASRSRQSSPFRAGSIFESPSSHPNNQGPHRSETMVSPEESSPPPPSNDGTNDQINTSQTPIPARSESVKRTQFKAEIWSDLYKDLLSRPKSPDAAQITLPSPSMSTLKPGLPVTEPSRPQRQLDPQARIRRFPSVTVIDDRKGHVRSVSLISVRAGRAGGAGMGVERESTLDLLEMIQVREREERERLLGVGAQIVVEAGSGAV